MSTETEAETTPKTTSLRLWPAVLIVALMWGAIMGTAWLAPGTMAQFMTSFYSPIVGLALMVLWWLLASRLAWRERLLGLAVCLGIIVAMGVFADPKMLFPMLMRFVPWMLLAIVGTLLLGATLPWKSRRWLPVAVVALTAAIGVSLRFDGADGTLNMDFSPRWSPTHEEVFVSQQKTEPKNAATAALELPMEPAATDWPEFRGIARDGLVGGVTFPTDWKSAPPREVWRRKVGPGWSSFTVIGNTIFTQEQRGEQEVVSAYDAQSGAQVWLNEIQSRFDEAVGGPGPRATPTYHEGKLYAQGAAGKVLCIDASNGQTIWTRDLTEDTPAKAPMWGFSSSPLVIGDLVITYTAAGQEKSVIAYQRENGEIAWTAGDSTHGYSSPHRATLDGVEQVLVLSNTGVASFLPADGKLLWQHEWDLGPDMNRVVQPLVIGNDVLLGTFYGKGTQRFTVSKQGDAWTTEVKWTSRKMKPYFNDYVQHNDHLYGFDGKIFACVNLADGKLAWKRGRYGHGQVVLLKDMNTLLILGEQGELVLLEANPQKHVELAKIQALEGKTWNHPVVAGNRLFVRNGTEAACYELNSDIPTEVASR